MDVCYGKGGVETEDDKDYCEGWVLETQENAANCTKREEYR